MDLVEKLKLDRLRNKPVVVALLIVALTVLSVGFVSTALLSGHAGKDARFGQGMHHRGFGGPGMMQFAGGCQMHGMPPAGEFGGMPPQRGVRMMQPQDGVGRMPLQFGGEGFGRQELAQGQGRGSMPPSPQNQTSRFGQPA